MINEELIEKIRALKTPNESLGNKGHYYNEAIDDVLELLTGKKPEAPEARCIDCRHMTVIHDGDYVCEVRGDELGDEDGVMNIEDDAYEPYECSSFARRVNMERNKIGSRTCPLCNEVGEFYYFDTVYYGDFSGSSPKVAKCPSCEKIIYEPDEKLKENVK